MPPHPALVPPHSQHTYRHTRCNTSIAKVSGSLTNNCSSRLQLNFSDFHPVAQAQNRPNQMETNLLLCESVAFASNSSHFVFLRWRKRSRTWNEWISEPRTPWYFLQNPREMIVHSDESEQHRKHSHDEHWARCRLLTASTANTAVNTANTVNTVNGQRSTRPTR